MKKNLQALVLAALIGSAGVMSSCNKDDMDTIVVKRSGNLSVAIKDGENPVAEKKVRFYNATSGNEIDVLITDANGSINFGELNEGTYKIEVEIESPKYARISQEIQVISGQSTNRTIQVTDYVGNFVAQLTDSQTNENVTGGLGLGLAFVPYNDAFERARNPKEIFELANDVQYFGDNGEISVDLPTAYYIIYEVRGDSILVEWDDLTIRKLEDRFFRYYVSVSHEKIKNKAAWSVLTTTDESGNTVSDFPVASFRFYIENYSRKCDVVLSNGVVFKSSYNFYTNSIRINGTYSTDGNYYFSANEFAFEFDAQGNLVLDIPFLRVEDYTSGNPLNFSDYDLSVKLN